VRYDMKGGTMKANNWVRAASVAVITACCVFSWFEYQRHVQQSPEAVAKRRKIELLDSQLEGEQKSLVRQWLREEITDEERERLWNASKARHKMHVDALDR